ncbi:MAG: class I tRNA ligase family protein, partial [Phycisphaeraceae bacterium]
DDYSPSSATPASADTHRGEYAPARCEDQLRFYPARYAKTFQQWHENIRDWCISRQLWWGHRIPVWTKSFSNCIEAQNYQFPSDVEPYVHARFGDGKADAEEMSVCVGSGHPSVEQALESLGFTQDPDVLDTWFSSALWPISTLGWPDPAKFPDAFPDGVAALNLWNPSNTLCTAREIITLWVSRMVMFNIYFRGCVPFRDVFIHAMIQDGHGQKMSKTLGNGIDPLDTIHSHGSDAMRFTLAAMTTQTQDVRMTVEVVCPHCGNAFTPKFTQSKGGTVAAPTQECPSPACKKPMVSSYGASSGKAKPTDEMPVARNTSEKFDSGRNFANKLWNAVRFALGSVGTGAAPSAGAPSRQGGAIGERPADAPDAPGVRTGSAPPCRDGALADRWILSRLSATIAATDKALEGFEFKPYADGLYDFIWRDFCDWYIEAIKPTVADDANQQRVLVSVIDAILRLLHPVMPFITEKLWERLNAVAPSRGVEGLELPASELLIRAKWPAAGQGLRDAAAEAEFESVQQIVGALREVRTTYKVPPRLKVECSIKIGAPSRQGGAEGATNAQGHRPSGPVLQHVDLIASLANVEVAAIGADVTRAQDAAAARVGETELYLHGLI